MKNQSIKNLIQVLYQTVGIKRYMRDLEKLLDEKLTDLTPMEKETIMMLSRDLNSNNNRSQNGQKRWW